MEPSCERFRFVCANFMTQGICIFFFPESIKDDGKATPCAVRLCKICEASLELTHWGGGCCFLAVEDESRIMFQSSEI